MLIKANLQEIIEHNDLKITDNSCCGKCSKCGE